MPIPRPDGELDQVTTNPNPENGASGVSSQLSFPTLGLLNRETEDNPTGCQLPLKERVDVSQGPDTIHGKDNGFSTSHMVGSTTLQSPAEYVLGIRVVTSILY